MFHLMILEVRLIFIIILFLFSCQNSYQLNTIIGSAQGTFYSVKYFSKKKTVTKLQIDSLLSEIDLSLSTYKPESLISRINRNKETKLDNYLNQLLVRSLKICDQTNGFFDVTIAPVVNMYGFGYDKVKYDDKINYDSIIGCDKIIIKDNTIFKKNSDIKIDINGIAQGYSVDIISNFLRSKKIYDFIVNIGGEIFCSGNKKGDDWIVAIEKPFMNIQKPMYILNLSNKALATSGSYRKIKKIDNKIISHTMSPKNFLPVKNELISVSIMADNCMDADAYATACMAMGLVKSKKFIKNHKIDACFIYKSNDDTITYITQNLLKLVSSNSPNYLDLQASSGGAPQ
tara:strand:- start:998 stop:2029 length:1032 start_codon:yes stop_codon:yes gene_type:complete